MDFEREYLQRVPAADVIPSVEEYARSKEPTYNGIDPPGLEDIGDDHQIQEAKKQEKAPELTGEKVYHCRGHNCDWTGKYSIAKYAHEKRCEKFANTKV